MKSKKQLQTEFTEMRSVEQSAQNLYTKITQDEQVTDERVKKLFAALAKDEKYHVQIVEKILQQIENNL